jgi:hypothetical protein
MNYGAMHVEFYMPIINVAIARNFSLHHSVQTGSGAHLSNGYQGLLLWG